MSDKIKNLIVVIVSAGFVFLFFIWGAVKPSVEISDSERRKLALMPELSINSVISGKFMQNYETYAADQFPLRESFRRVKALSAFYLFRQKDVNGIYQNDGYLSKIEYPLHSDSLENAAAKFRKIYDKYLKDADAQVYLSIVPDKNYFLAKQNGYPALDYPAFTEYMREQTDFMQYIDISELLELSDYYNTDTHWRQEKIGDVAKKLCSEMGVALAAEYSENLLAKPFYGVYYGQAALPYPAEELYYLTNDTLNACTVFDYEINKELGIYDMEKSQGRDPYEIFLSGSKSLLKVTNPNAQTDKKLILFRDSFGSSIAPLLVPGYSEVILADIRYISSDVLGNFIEFENSDVLFLYSALVLNNSIEFK